MYRGTVVSLEESCHAIAFSSFSPFVFHVAVVSKPLKEPVIINTCASAVVADCLLEREQEFGYVKHFRFFLSTPHCQKGASSR